MTKLIGDLEALQSEIITIIQNLPEKEFRNQFHPDLSPIGWHLGHCVYIESYWIREQLLKQAPLEETLRSLYVPEMSIKDERGNALPDKHAMIEWTRSLQKENRLLLENCLNNSTQHHLLENDFLFHFLIQHYSQHLETIKMIQTEIQLYKNIKPDKAITFLTTNDTEQDSIKIPSGNYFIGSDNNHFPYDNEHPKHKITLNTFEISRLLVSNTEYLAFINDDGYNRKELWSTEGWKWKIKNKIESPHHWRFDQGWYGINHEGAYSLSPEQAVYGLSFYEASAYTNRVNARLPHEYEWETACNEKQLEQTCSVWEWCHNYFHPYPGFVAYPYEGYSAPYFDKQHYVIRGGSRYTKPAIRRSSFRNYYAADKRHIFAGLRLVYK